ncbi:T9SS type A sorting domain-containing protein [Tamlana sp. 2_MG-2023]|uniref:T9SS type A sorting domain-containing protein n=1 Tax=unclassified Tamlana TaxID=2614803 RepID=UPI0026E2FCA4|nr:MULTISPECIES: T9SS type A sorting domain-containing protein [unclassified Tamlana]MDO6758563.1 T9SS type A sorting domain-containing protein [Tamlana sp. 2_MG-2023]MDO6789262.1 T9SS type A sorting domain-containing protein [Tamlana sp. 1_MG-2023]
MLITTIRKMLFFFCVTSSAFLFAQDFTETVKLAPSIRRSNQYFGGSVGISGDYAIVGAYGEAYDVNEENPIQYAGAAYIYEKEEGVWRFKQKLVQEHRWYSDHFGVMVSIEGEYAVVGITGEDMDDPEDPNSNRSTQLGVAMVYKRDTDGIWKEHQLIHGGDERVSGEQFGFPVKIKEGVILVGALNTSEWLNGEYLPRTGSVYVFEKDALSDQWVKVKKLKGSDRVGQDVFGKMVDISNGTIIIGAAKHDPQENDYWVGAAYVFSKDETGEWIEEQILEASNRSNKAQFGESVAISGDYIFIGAPTHPRIVSGTGVESGAAYVFKKDYNGDWKEVQYIILEDASNFAEAFGQSISASGNRVIVSADKKPYISEEYGLRSKGVCYLYELNDDTDNWDLIQTIIPKYDYSDKEFGLHVIMSNNKIIVGDGKDNGGDQNINSSGAAHIFEIPESLSISDLNNVNPSVFIYPNPVESTFFIQSKKILKDSHVLIIDMLGRRVYESSKITINGNHAIEVNLSKGSYILKIVSEGKTYTSKFVK